MELILCGGEAAWPRERVHVMENVGELELIGFGEALGATRRAGPFCEVDGRSWRA